MTPQERQEYIDLRAEAVAAGDQALVSRLDAWAKSPVAAEPTSNQLLGGARSFTEGATFNWGDELGLGLAAIPAWLGEDRDMSYGDVYRDMRDSYDLEQNQYRREHPGQSMALGLAGGLGGGLYLGSKLALNAPTAAGRLLQGGAVGAAEGAVSGAGRAEDVAGIPLAAAEDTLWGTAGGAAGAGLAEAAARATRMAPADARAAQVARESLAADQLRTPVEIGDAMTALGPEGRMADLGPNMQGLAMGTTLQPGAAQRIGTQALENRQLGQQGRVMAPVKQQTAYPGTYIDTVDDLITSRRKASGPLYDEVRQTRVDMPDDILAWRDLPAFRGIFTKADNMYQRYTKRIPDEGTMGELEYWDYVKRAMDDAEGEAKRAGRGAEANAVTQTRRELISVLDEQAEVYPAARKAFEEPTKLIDASKQGQSILRDDVNITAKQLRAMTDAEKEAYRLGAADAIQTRMGSTSETGNTARTWLRRPNIRERLRPAFRSDEAYDDFLTLLENEAQMGDTYRLAMPGTGSRTAQGLATQKQADLSPLGAMWNAFQGRFGAASMDAARALTNALTRGRQGASRMTDDQRTTLARLLFEKGPNEAAEFLARTAPDIEIPGGFAGAGSAMASQTQVEPVVSVGEILPEEVYW